MSSDLWKRALARRAIGTVRLEGVEARVAYTAGTCLGVRATTRKRCNCLVMGEVRVCACHDHVRLGRGRKPPAPRRPQGAPGVD